MLQIFLGYLHFKNVRKSSMGRREAGSASLPSRKSSCYLHHGKSECMKVTLRPHTRAVRRSWKTNCVHISYTWKNNIFIKTRRCLRCLIRPTFGEQNNCHECFHTTHAHTDTHTIFVCLFVLALKQTL